jgi:hypothetical protein
MQIQSASAYSSISSLFPARAKEPLATAASPAAAAATAADRTTISQAARELFAASQAKPAAQAASGATGVYDTDQGAKTFDIDEYFTPPSGGYRTLPPLLLPSQRNIDALSKHISATLPGFLAENNIPSPPSSITYDNEGQIQLPADYAYATEFKEALAKTPTLARELSTVSALTSHRVEMKKVIPFHQEYAAATSQAVADSVVAKYRHLFSGNHHYDTIALNFAANGSLTLTADGKPIA